MKRGSGEGHTQDSQTKQRSTPTHREKREGKKERVNAFFDFLLETLKNMFNSIQFNEILFI